MFLELPCSIIFNMAEGGVDSGVAFKNPPVVAEKPPVSVPTTENLKEIEKKDPWKYPFKLQGERYKEIKKFHEAVSYEKIVKDARIILLGDLHGSNSIKDHIEGHISELKVAGITHFLVEVDIATQAIFDRMNMGEMVDLSNVYLGLGSRKLRKTLPIVAAQGLKLIAINVPLTPSTSKEDREKGLAQNIQKIVSEDTTTKVAVLIGTDHTRSYHLAEKEVPTVAERLTQTGIPMVRVNFLGGDTNQAWEQIINEAGLKDKEFMIDLRPFEGSIYVPLAGRSDLIIHLQE